MTGLPRIFKNRDDMIKIEQLHESRYNGFTICTGNLGENPVNDLPSIIRWFVPKDRVSFMQVHNIKYVGENAFHESAHPSSEGSLDTFDIMKALYMIPIMTGIFVPTTAEIFGARMVIPVMAYMTAPSALLICWDFGKR